MKLTKTHVELDNLLIDPNNPRFADISDESLNIPIQRFADPEVQNNAFNKMMNVHFDVLSLANSIETVGFLQVDNIVAKKLDNEKYVIIEGNRRVTALKYIVHQYRIGQSLLSDDTIKQFLQLEILVVDNAEDANDNIGKIIQGIRNVSGIKEWAAYQKAQFISDMIEKGKEPGTISKMIGMQVKDINRYYKTYSAMGQFKRDEEYGGKWKHSYFSYFDEIVKRPALRKYFGWNEEHYIFSNQEHIHRFYDWIIPNDEDLVAFTDARDVRHLVDLIDDDKALNYLDDRNLQKAINYFQQKSLNVPKITLPECINRINSAIDAFKNIVGEGLEADMTREDVEEMSKKIEEMKKQISRIRILKENES